MSRLETREGLPRRILPWIIERANSDDEFAAHEVTSRSLLHLQLWAAVHDATELAEMIAAETRRCGLTVLSFTARSSFQFVSIGVHEFDAPLRTPCANGPEQGVKLEMVHYPGPSQGIDRFWRMAQARIILAALLQLPDEAREQAGRILRGESNG